MNVKKYITSIAAAAMIIGFAGSCGKQLDIKPRQNIDQDSAIRNAADVDLMITGIYSIMGGPGLYGTDLEMLPELYVTDKNNSAAYCGWLGTFNDQRQIANKTIVPANGNITRIWVQAYRAINSANIVLESLDVVSDANQKNAFRGEALFLRGLLHFELVRLYGKQWSGGPAGANPQDGVPLELKAVKSEDAARQKLARKSVSEVYAQVIKDLTDAAAAMPESNGLRANRYAALAILARVYLQQGDYAKARDAANSVLSINRYSPNPDVLTVFRSRNTLESIWELQQNDQNNAGNANDGLATFYDNISNGDAIKGRADFMVADAFKATFDAADLRAQELIYTGTGSRPGTLACGKYTEFGQNIPLIRITEMYLVRAECNLRLGTSIGDTPANDLDQSRHRAGLPRINTPTANDVVKERVFEFFGEGLVLHDVKRLFGKTYGGLSWDDNKMIFPVPDRERKANSALSQNPGYPQ